MGGDELRGLEDLKRSLQAFLRGNAAGSYQALCAEERVAHDLSEILLAKICMILERDRIGCAEPAGEPGADLAGILIQMARLAQSGVLEEALTPGNLGLLAENGRQTIDLAETALRKKDRAAYLRHSGDTDAHLADAARMRELLAKKDR